MWDQQVHVQYDNSYIPYVLIVCSYKSGCLFFSYIRLIIQIIHTKTT